jgi:hypothetical protein
MRADLGSVTLPRRTVWLYRAVTIFSTAMLVVLTAIAHDPYTPFVFWGAWALFLSLFPFLPRSGARAEVEVTPRPGALEVREGTILWSIKSREVTAASTARRGRKVSLALGRKSATVEPPFTLDFDSEKDAAAAREALGLGHFGHGSLAWPLAAPASNVLVGMMAATIGAAGFYLTGRGCAGDGAASALVIFGTMLEIVGAILLRYGGTDVVPTLFLRADGLHWRRGNEWTVVAFTDIRGTSMSDALYVWTNTRSEPWRIPLRRWAIGGWGMTRPQAEHVAAQIEAAARRARGEGDLPPEVSATVELLARGERESLRAWIERLDGAAALLGAGAGYRGAALSEEDLWAALENPDATATIRAGAARILSSRGQGARARIAIIAERERDETVEKKIRVAVEPDASEAEWRLRDLENVEDVDAPAVKLLRKP